MLVLPRLSALVVCALFLASELRSQRDNVLILLADDVGVDAVNVYGEVPSPPPTPNLDALAARGVLFRNAWAYPLCSPTRACIQTGRFGLRTGIGRGVQPSIPPANVLSLAETTLPELLDAQGSSYRHAYIGKWHLGDDRNGGALGPNLAGWSHFAGVVSGNSAYFNYPWTVNGITTTVSTYRTTHDVNQALAWIQTAPEPWVCQVSFIAAHEPFHAPPPALHTQTLPPMIGEQPVPFFKAMVEAMDTEIGRLLRSLGPAMLSRTNVIFIGDNGTTRSVIQSPFVASHGKGTLYEGGLNVPLIVAGPAVRSAPREEAALVSAVDVFATVADLCGVQPTVPFVKIDGVSFAPHLRSANAPPVRSTVYAEWFAPSNPGTAAVRDARYKLIRFLGQSRDEFYDLLADPFELNDLVVTGMTAAQQATYQSLGSVMNATRSTTAKVSSYGATACVGSNGNPAIQLTGIPTIGSSYTASLQNGARNQPAVLYVGASNSAWGGLGLPFPLALVGGGPGCFLYSSGEFVASTTTDGSGRASVPLALPNQSTLVAASFHHSWLVLDPGAPNNPFGLTGSDGATAVIGGHLN